MKFYIAGRSSKAEEIQSIRDHLMDLGHVPSHDWTEFQIATGFDRPYPEHITTKIAEEEIAGVKEADIFILISDKQGTGMYVEFGYALAHAKHIYSIGEHNETTVFQFLPKVKRMSSFTEVLEDLKSL